VNLLIMYLECPSAHHSSSWGPSSAKEDRTSDNEEVTMMDKSCSASYLKVYPIFVYQLPLLEHRQRLNHYKHCRETKCKFRLCWKTRWTNLHVYINIDHSAVRFFSWDDIEQWQSGCQDQRII